MSTRLSFRERPGSGPNPGAPAAPRTELADRSAVEAPETDAPYTPAAVAIVKIAAKTAAERKRRRGEGADGACASVALLAIPASAVVLVWGPSSASARACGFGRTAIRVPPEDTTGQGEISNGPATCGFRRRTGVDGRSPTGGAAYPAGRLTASSSPCGLHAA